MPALNGLLYRGQLNEFECGLGERDKFGWELRTGVEPIPQVNEPTDQIPGNTSTPYSIPIGGQDTGVINTLGDRDWFAVTLIAGEVYIFTLTGSGGAPLSDPYLVLYNSAGVQIAFNDDADFPVDFNSVLTFTPTTSGTYYLGAQAFDDSVTGGYTLTADISTPLDAINWMQTMTTTSIDVYFATAGQVFNGETALRNWTTSEVNAAMAALNTFAQVTTLTFNQVFSPTGAEMVLTLADVGEGTLGYFQVGTPYGFFNPNAVGWDATGLQQGGYGFVTLIHELGHGLGLAHPHDNGGSSTIMPGVTAPFDDYGDHGLNQGVFTTMSYNDGWPGRPGGAMPSLSGHGWQGTPMALDIAMLQQFYGVNATANSGHTTYTLQSTDYFYRAIWDVGGIDTIAYNGAASAVIDLRAATIEYEIGGGGWISYVNGVHGGFTIANGVVIENATGGSGADTISGNSAINQLNGGGGADIVNGGDGDTLLGGDGDDTLHGGGNITLLGESGDDVMHAAPGDVIDGGDGLDYVTQIDLSASTSNVVFDGALAMSSSGLIIGGYVIRNTEGYTLLTGTGNDVLSLQVIAGPGGWVAGAGFDHLIVDLSATSEDTNFGISTFFVGSDQLHLNGVEMFTLTGGSGDDGWNGGEFSDTMTGNAGNDGLHGGGGDDLLDGGIGNDVLGGGSGDDDLSGGDGADQLAGDAGADTMLGGGGDDFVAGGDAGDWIDGGDGNDKIQLAFGQDGSSFAFDATAMAAGLTFTNGAHVRNFERFDLFTGAGHDQVSANHTNAGSIWHAYDGIDRLILDLSAVDGAISVTYSIADPISLEGVRIDVAWNGLNIAARFIELVSIAGGSAADTLVGLGLIDSLAGGGGNDVLRGAGGADILNGGTGVDTSAYALSSGAATWLRNVDGSWTVTSADGTDTLTSVEFLDFTDRDVFLDRAQRTFSGNGTSDVLFRRSDGIMASWEVTGTTINAASFLPTAGAEWSVLGAGDVSGDGRDDVLWQRSDGLVYAWVMNGGAVSAAVGLTGIGAEWTFLGMGDFNGDLTDDFAWRRDDGVVFTWTMQNTTIQSANGVTGLGADWQIAGFGDFNGDGRDDFLWRNVNTGQSVVWHMNGSAIQSFGETSVQSGLDWAVVGVGDTNGDGRDDIVLQRASDGMIAVWAMDGTTAVATNVAAANPNEWTVRGVGDYNGDGREDILWQNDTGLVYVWLMNGAAIQAAGALSGIGDDWSII